MARLIRFFDKPAADQRLLLIASLLFAAVTAAIRVLPFGNVRRALAWIGAARPRPGALDEAEARVVRAVHTVASLWPGENCLTEAMVAQCLLARYQCETTLCFGVSRVRPAGRPFDAHAWLERGGAGLIGTRAIVYDPLVHPSRCASSPSPR